MFCYSNLKVSLSFLNNPLFMIKVYAKGDVKYFLSDHIVSHLKKDKISPKLYWFYNNITKVIHFSKINIL